MAIFAYQMQSILNIKYKLENQEKIAFSNAQLRLKNEEHKMTQIKEKKSFYEKQMRNEMQDRLNVQELISCNQGIGIMKEAKKLQQVEVNMAQKKVDRARICLNEAMIERKTHEKLRENAFEEFIKGINAQESKEIDELVSYSYASTIV